MFGDVVQVVAIQRLSISSIELTTITLVGRSMCG
jgi:hypothetical protein